MSFMTAVLAAVPHAESVKAKNPIVPEGKEILWGAICFAIVFGILAWKAWPAIKKAIQDVSEYVTSTAAAIEEQSTVTSEMSTGMQRAATEAASIGLAA